MQVREKVLDWGLWPMSHGEGSGQGASRNQHGPGNRQANTRRTKMCSKTKAGWVTGELTVEAGQVTGEQKVRQKQDRNQEGNRRTTKS